MASAVALRMVDYGRAAIGTPYVWGGAAPSGYDCSGLIYAAARSTGRSFPWRSSEEQWAGLSDHRVPWGSWAPGDLVFANFGSEVSPGHVVLYAGRGWCICAEHTGTTVEWLPVSTFRANYVGSARPFPLPAGTAAPPQGPNDNPTPATSGYDPTVPTGDSNLNANDNSNTDGSSGNSNAGAGVAAVGGGAIIMLGLLVIVAAGAAYLIYRNRQAASPPTDAPGGGSPAV